MDAATELASVLVKDGTSEPSDVASVVTVLIVPNLFWVLLLRRISKILEYVVFSVILLDVLDCLSGNS
jgi:hypothetical protein